MIFSLDLNHSKHIVHKANHRQITNQFCSYTLTQIMYFRIMLEIQTILQIFLQTTDVVTDYC